MRPKTVGALSALGMFFTSVTVYSLTPNGGFGAPEVPPEVAGSTLTWSGRAVPEAGSDPSHFLVEEALRIEGRLGHSSVQRQGRSETFVMLELQGETGAATAPAAAGGQLAIVLDQSGSMRGSRLANAKSAALRAIDGLRDGDIVSVVSFDTRARVVVSPTRLDGSTRRQVTGAVQAIPLGGDTCISCGVDVAIAELNRAQTAGGGAKRMLVLSDGDANNGVRDVVGFRDLGKRALDLGVEITTVGVSLEYNELFLGAVAETSNGRHYFVENDAGLVRVFEEEARFATGTVASDVVVEVELSPGVQLTRVFDRTFSRSGSTLRIPVGALSRGELKTVLLQVTLPGAPSGAPGETQPVVTTRIHRRDAATGASIDTERTLAARLVDDRASASPLDAVVAARLQRTETASILERANELARKGKLDEARLTLAQGRDALGANADAAKESKPSSRSKNVSDDFDDQSRALAAAEKDFSAAPVVAALGALPAAPKKPAPSAGTKRAVESANAYRR